MFIALAVAGGISAYSAVLLRHLVEDDMSKELSQRAAILQEQFAAWLAKEDKSPIDQACKAIGRLAHMRVTVVLTNGTVVGDSDENPARMENHGQRPEIVRALEGALGKSVRYSTTMRKRMLYVAFPLHSEGRIIGVLRLSVPLTTLSQAALAYQRALLAAALVAVMLAAMVSFAVARRISRPLEAMKEGARRLARGEFGHSLREEGTEETAHLAQALNEMATRLEEVLRCITAQRNQLNAVLAGMNEGVMALDAEGRILLMNRCAGVLLGVEPDDARGRTPYEITDAPVLLRLLEAAARGEEPSAAEMVLRHAGERVVKAAVVPLRNGDGAPAGAIAVLRDVTKETKLERVRRDFVANVSHELRTPITAIKGFAESLLDGAREDAAEATEFLRTIVRHADRLNRIIEDLLLLSRLEQEPEPHKASLTRQPLLPVLEAAVDELAPLAAEMKAEVALACGEELQATVNASLLQQAITNLIDNALKHGGEGVQVQVSAQRKNGEVEITVSDNGPGIAAEHLERVFERFYRADRTASRRFGGTGLGLAIVRHIALVHGGRAEAESSPGAGSIFRFVLPGT